MNHESTEFLNDSETHLVQLAMMGFDDTGFDDIVKIFDLPMHGFLRAFAFGLQF